MSRAAPSAPFFPTVTASNEAATFYSFRFFFLFSFSPNFSCFQTYVQAEVNPGKCKYLEPTNGVSGYFWVANTILLQSPRRYDVLLDCEPRTKGISYMLWTPLACVVMLACSKDSLSRSRLVGVVPVS